MLFIMLQWSVPYNVLGDVLQCLGISLIIYIICESYVILIVVNSNVCIYNYASHCKKNVNKYYATRTRSTTGVWPCYDYNNKL